ncbi:MAG TPA: hypothetical protein VGP46_00725, partial [Acidimicrobiales bacterium]|nr:hypothetical protein [Acidimicrobiales bacterium]
VWNPHFGEVWFLATICCGLAVLAGRVVWLPALVVCGSVAMQAHVMFTLPSALIVTAGGLVAVYAVVRKRGGVGGLVGGVVAAAVCWIAPVYQQLTNTPGNVGALLNAHTGKTMGLDYGLRAISNTTLGQTLWLKPTTSKRLLDVRVIQHTLASGGTWVLILSALLLPLALVLRSRLLGAMAFVNLSLLVGVCFEFGKTPRHGLVATYYLVETLYPAGVFCWLTFLTAVVVAVRFAWAHLSDPSGSEDRKPGRLDTLWAALAGVVALGALAWTLTGEAPAFDNPAADDHVAALNTVCSQIKAQARPGPLRLTLLAPTGAATEQLLFGVGACMQANGYNPEPTKAGYAAELGPSFSPQPGAPGVTVNFDLNPPTVHVTGPSASPAQ